MAGDVVQRTSACPVSVEPEVQNPDKPAKQNPSSKLPGSEEGPKQRGQARSGCPPPCSHQVNEGLAFPGTSAVNKGVSCDTRQS